MMIIFPLMQNQKMKMKPSATAPTEEGTNGGSVWRSQKGGVLSLRTSGRIPTKRICHVTDVGEEHPGIEERGRNACAERLQELPVTVSEA